jgi:hypothetical protein
MQLVKGSVGPGDKDEFVVLSEKMVGDGLTDT